MPLAFNCRAEKNIYRERSIAYVGVCARASACNSPRSRAPEAPNHSKGCNTFLRTNRSLFFHVHARQLLLSSLPLLFAPVTTEEVNATRFACLLTRLNCSDSTLFLINSKKTLLHSVTKSKTILLKSN